jgi:TonB family protein
MMWSSSSRRCLPTLVVTIVAMLAAASAVRAQKPTTPVTMGSLVMMRMNGDSGATEAIGAALSHPEPGMRAVAARLVAVGRLFPVRSQLITALATEKVDAVAAEQVRALVLLESQDAMDAATAHLAKAGPRARDAFALEAARLAPDRFIAELQVLMGEVGAGGGEQLVPAISLGLRLHPAMRGALLAAWLDRASPSTWSDITRHLAVAPTADASEVPVLVATLSSPQVEHREPTVWLLLNWLGRSQNVPAALLQAALPRSDDGGALTWERFGRELVARHVTSDRTEDRSTFLAREAGTRQLDARAIAALKVLTRQEQAALDRALGGPQPARPAGASPPASTPRVGVFDNIWGGFLGSLLDATGCQPTDDWRFGGVRLTYSSEGRPTRLAVDPSRVSESCARATMALAQVSLSHRSDPVSEGDLEWVLLPTALEFVACADSLDRTAASNQTGFRVTSERRDIEEPRRSRDVRPRYPPGAQQRGVSGVVILEAMISKEGCIRTARVLRSVDPELDLEAIRTVTQWRYTGARLRGEPVDVIMTVTVNFTLN